MTKIDPSNFVTQDNLKEQLNDAQKRTDHLMVGVIIILVIGFITLLIAVISPILDAWRFKASTYQTLVNQVNEQNYKIDSILMEIKEINSQKINNKESEIKALKDCLDSGEWKKCF